jgi:hypothetical protein
LAIRPEHVLGIGISDLSLAQLRALEDVHTAQLSDIQEAKHRLGALEQRELAEELARTKSEVADLRELLLTVVRSTGIAPGPLLR